MRLRRGQLVSVEFLDHCEGGDLPVVCRVYGRLHETGRGHLVVTAWETVGQDRETQAGNETRYTIVRSAIRRVAQLEERG